MECHKRNNHNKKVKQWIKTYMGKSSECQHNFKRQMTRNNNSLVSSCRHTSTFILSYMLVLCTILNKVAVYLWRQLTSRARLSLTIMCMHFQHMPMQQLGAIPFDSFAFPICLRYGILRSGHCFESFIIFIWYPCRFPHSWHFCIKWS